MTKPLFKLSPVVAAVLGVAFSSPSFGGEAIVFDNGAKLDWKATTTYTLATRLRSPDALLANDSADYVAPDGDNNFKKGALTANRVALLLEGKLSKDRSGLVLSASTFYDDVYHGKTDNRAVLILSLKLPPSLPHGVPGARTARL